ncbi:Bug family tripartite tricarboxylate transporter substrate binding protein [Bordetella tumulicola]|uniref:Bug family tripartite tricarboxylate transporter substrate binding protein n=1 Tax=Bordetella tumulicola TaxID=1649133 RepID=UPI0039F06D1B
MKKRMTLSLMGAGLLIAFAGAAHAAYPDRAVTVVVPYPPGGTTDILARIVSAKLTGKLGQTFVVENKPGASGMIGTQAVARAKPDGYTIMMGTIGTHGTNAAVYKNVLYDTVKDFNPVVIIASTPNVMVANKNAPYNTVAEFLEYARKHPGEVNFGSTSMGGSPHMSGELLKAQAGIDIVHVPFQGGGPMLNAVIGGQIPVAFDNLPSSAGHIQSGNLKALGVTTPQRWPSFKDVPTIAESGVPGYEVQAWFGILAPAGTPTDIVNKLNKSISDIITDDADIQKQLATMGAMHTPNTPEQFSKLITDEVQKWTEVVEKNNMEKL